MAYPDPRLVKELRESYERNGYVRPPLEKWSTTSSGRRAKKGRHLFRRGFEVRLTADTKVQLRRLRAVLWRCGFRPGRPFTKANQFRQPIYGREQVERFLDLVGVSTPTV